MRWVLPILVAGLAGCRTGTAPVPSEGTPIRSVPFHRVEVTDPFWTRRIAINRQITVRACLDQCERTGRLQNFAVAGGLASGEFRGRRYNDSDVYKVIEGAAYALHGRADAELEARVDAIIDTIAAAQRSDGYLNSYYTLVKPQERWTDIAHGHELYCAGHLIEAGIAYARATGKRKLLDVAIRFADLIDREFGPGKRLDPPGHQELELALLKLADETGERRWADLARFFLEQRGSPARAKRYGEYSQDHAPVREQTEPVGHAVRAMYQYSAMADVVARDGDDGMRAALEAIWTQLVDGKMYVTGGIGANASNEGFTEAWHLPNDKAYAETCAAIGLALWNHRMFLLTGEARFVDVAERAIYNGMLSGVSLWGDRFFYTNPLASRGADERRPWYDTACCPSNVVRFLPAIGGRIWAHAGDTVFVLMPIGSKTEIDIGRTRVGLEIDADYPWSGAFTVGVNPERPATFELRIRIPDWCGGEWAVTSPDTSESGPWEQAGGFVPVRRRWRAGDRVEVRLPAPPVRVRDDPRVAANRGRVALQSGPLIYCLEGVDHEGHARNLVLPEGASLRRGPAVAGLQGVGSIEADGRAVHEEDGERVVRPARLRAIPYFAWANRGRSEMVVWIPEKPELAEVPGETPFERAGDVKVRASHCWRGDTVTAALDGELPGSSDDHSIPRMTWWPRKGSTEWLAYELPEQEVGHVEVYWFDDGPRGGGCRTPRAWRLLWRDGSAWKPVAPTAGGIFGNAPNRLHRLTFRPVKTTGLRLEVDLRDGFSGGVLEWRFGR